MTERRHFPRTEVTRPVTATTSRRTELRLLDVSVTGLRSLSRTPLRPGQVIRIFLPTGNSQLAVDAAVRRCRAVTGRDGFPGIAYETGLEFVNLDQPTIATIQAAYLGNTPPAQEAADPDRPPEVQGFSMVQAG